jgi:hypothetical protein
LRPAFQRACPVIELPTGHINKPAGFWLWRKWRLVFGEAPGGFFSYASGRLAFLHLHSLVCPSHFCELFCVALGSPSLAVRGFRPTPSSLIVFVRFWMSDIGDWAGCLRALRGTCISCHPIIGETLGLVLQYLCHSEKGDL